MRPLREPITGQEILPPLRCVLFAEIIREHVHMLVRQWKLEGIDVRRICQLQRNVARACWMFKEWVTLSVLFCRLRLQRVCLEYVIMISVVMSHLGGGYVGKNHKRQTS